MKTFWKVVLMVVGFWLGNGMIALLVIPDARVSIMPDGFDIGKMFMAIGLALVGYGLLVLGIILLVRDAKKKKAQKAYNSTKKSYSSSSSSSSYSNPTPKPKPAPAPSPKPQEKPKYPVSSVDITQYVKRASRYQIGFTNTYLEVDYVYVKELSGFSFDIEVDLKAYGSVTIKDEVDASRYQSAVESAIKGMVDRIGDILTQYHNQYGFGYSVGIRDIQDSVNYSTY